MQSPRTIIEPFRIKSVEPLPLLTRADRLVHLRNAHYNPFLLRGEHVTIDLLTDSGTGAMSAKQWAALMLGDETYAGSRSYFRLAEVVRDLTGMRHVIPTHQGRASEHILFHVLQQRQIANGLPPMVVPSNSFFDTTRANCEYHGGIALDLLTDEGKDPTSEHPFKGNISLPKLKATLDEHGPNVPLVLVTVTNNKGGGQPVSLANLRAVRRICDDYGVPLYLDAARFAENAWLIREREAGQSHRMPEAIAKEMFRLADGFVMSAKKDGLVHIGGLLCINDDELADAARSLLILTEGFPTYGGLAGRDLEALAVGLTEVLDRKYLAYRHASVRYLFEKLDAMGVPLVRPPGGHAVFIDAGRFYPHIPPWQYPGVVLANALYIQGGVRAVEIGTAMFGAPDPAGGPDVCADHELVRLALPRRSYTQSHVDYLIEVVGAAWNDRSRALGLDIVEQKPVLRAFTARYEPRARPRRSSSAVPPADSDVQPPRNGHGTTA